MYADLSSFFNCTLLSIYFFFFFNDTATTEIYTLSLHDALPIFIAELAHVAQRVTLCLLRGGRVRDRSEEHTSELQSPDHLVCRLLLEKKKTRLNLSTNEMLRTD